MGVLGHMYCSSISAVLSMVLMMFSITIDVGLYSRFLLLVEEYV